ncbi:MAG: sigma-70 family RNA polymerase sigma factor [Bacteroidetes bacterium]|nr:sigma-70 family RNA polymerase sigma factor [Bacteroidota bacterium]
MAEFSDQELLLRFRDPDNHNRHYAFNLLVKKYQQKVYGHVRRMVIDHDDANDLIQNTFIKVWQHLDGFREDSQLYTWIYRIATNECLGFLKQKRKRFFLPIGDVEGELSQKLVQDRPMDVNKLELKLQQAILSLPEKQRTVFNLRYYDNMKYEEMSEVLGTSVGALKASYHHAVAKVEKIIRGD